ncbi:hypothetical protein ACLKA6_019368 [Drosophila palustris]
MEQWNNVELTSITKKSYTLNHDYDDAEKPKKADDTTSSPKNSSNGNGNGNANDQVAVDGDTVLQPGSDIKPKVRPEDVEPLVRRLYGITVSELKEMISYDDRNYLIQEDW